jgi:tetratricopeptide (TPR) repeat protein
VAKKKKKKRTPRKPLRRGGKRKLTSFWRRRRETIRKAIIWGLAPAALLVGAVLVISYFSSRAHQREMLVHLDIAREQFLRSDFAEALLSYHRAQNEVPSNKGLTREATMIRERANLGSGGSVANAIAAADYVLKHDSSSVIAHLNLAQLYNGLGKLPSVLKHAHSGLQEASVAADTLAMLTAAYTLAYTFRQMEALDSAYHYNRRAVQWASTTGVTYDLALAESGLGFTALKMDSLELAARLFAEVEELGGAAYERLFDLSQLGWADYYYRVGNYDSCLVRASYVENLYRDQPYNANAAYAAYLIGRALAGEGKNDEGIIWLEEAADSYRAICGYSPLIDTFNDLARIHLEEREYAAARKYYLAASRLARAYGVPDKGKLDVNINNLFLDRLTSAEYVAAGDAGERLAEEIIAEMGLMR